ncbi:MAG TPA: hypothetical protein VN222_11520, partial [Novosphingobium sp.]|nr:hypothetical protein [Novosphingobium sp.]
MALWRERPTQAGAWLAGRGKAVAARLIAALRPTIVPTPRACAVLGGLALLALGLAAVAPGAWLAAPVLGLLVLGLSVADGILAGRLIALDIAAPAEVEVGREGAIALSARVSGTAPAIAARLMLDARLAPGGQAGAMLPASEGLAQGAVLVTPTR